MANTFLWNDVRTWLQGYQRQERLGPSSCGIVIGPPGIGKTTRVHALCTELGYDVVSLGSDRCSNARELRDHMTKACRCRLEAALRGSTAPRVVVLDDLETLIQMDRLIPSTLLAILQERALPDLPVLMVLQTSSEKKLADLRNKCRWWHMGAPSDVEVLLLLQQKYRGQVPMSTLEQIAEQSHGNISYALQTADMETRSHGHGGDAETDTSAGAVQSRATAATTAAMDVLPQLASIYTTRDRDVARRVLMEDPWLHPLRFHENILQEFHQRSGTRSQKERAYLAILEHLCTWDMWMSHGHGQTQGPESVDVSVEHMVSASTHVLQGLPRKPNAQDASLQDFTKMFSLLSIRKKHARSAHEEHSASAHLPSLAWIPKNYEVLG